MGYLGCFAGRESRALSRRGRLELRRPGRLLLDLQNLVLHRREVGRGVWQWGGDVFGLVSVGMIQGGKGRGGSAGVV